MLLLFIPTHVRSLMLLSQIAQFLHDITGLFGKVNHRSNRGGRNLKMDAFGFMIFFIQIMQTVKIINLRNSGRKKGDTRK